MNARSKIISTGQEPYQSSTERTPEGSTSGKEGQGQLFTAAQQAALETAIRAALTKAHSPTLPNLST